MINQPERQQFNNKQNQLTVTTPYLGGKAGLYLTPIGILTLASVFVVRMYRSPEGSSMEYIGQGSIVLFLLPYTKRRKEKIQSLRASGECRTLVKIITVGDVRMHRNKCQDDQEILRQFRRYTYVTSKLFHYKILK